MTDNIKQFPAKAPKAPKNPHWNKKVEQSTLGALLLNNAAWEQVAAMLTEQDFYDAKHQRIFRTIADLASKGVPFDVVTVGERLKESGQLGDAIDRDLGILANETPSTAHVTDYARLVRRYALERQLDAAWDQHDLDRVTELTEQINQLEEAGTANGSGKLGSAILTLQQLQDTALPERKLLNEIIIEGGQGLLYADAGLGKTYFALTLAAAAASGKPFMKWTTHEAVEALYIDGEMSLQEMQGRLNQLLPETPEKTLHLLSHEWVFQQDAHSDLRLCDPRQQDELRAYLDEHPGIKLVILDNLSCLFPGADEDSRDDWVRTVQPLMLWMRKRGIAGLLLHHTGKGGSQRGSSAREGIMDLVIKLARPSSWSPEDGAHFAVEFKKSRGLHGPVVEPFEAALDYGPDKKPVWTLQPQLSPERAEILELLEESGPLFPKEIGEALGKNPGTTRFLIHKLCQQEKLHRRFDGKYEVKNPTNPTNTTNTANSANSANTANSANKEDGPPIEAYLDDLAIMQNSEDNQYVYDSYE